MAFLYLKALHIIFVVTWFSGLFYLCRLMIYNREADSFEPAIQTAFRSQYNLMIRRLLLGICWPSAVLTWIFGLSLYSWYWPDVPVWLWTKVGMVVLLSVYHLSLHRIMNQQGRGDYRHSGNALRIWNEVPTVFLVGIVLLVVVRQGISLVYGALGLAGLIVVLLGGIRLYRKIREEKTGNSK